jgi:hypothetical protein
VLDRVVSNSTLSVELARRALHEEQQAQLKAALPAMRERLTVLIERRAGTLAEETYEERTGCRDGGREDRADRNDSFSERGCCPGSRGAALGLGIAASPCVDIGQFPAGRLSETREVLPGRPPPGVGLPGYGPPGSSPRLVAEAHPQADDQELEWRSQATLCRVWLRERRSRAGTEDVSALPEPLALSIRAIFSRRPGS